MSRAAGLVGAIFLVRGSARVRGERGGVRVASVARVGRDPSGRVRLFVRAVVAPAAGGLGGIVVRDDAPSPARAGVVEVDGDVRAPAASAAVVVADVRAPSAPGPARVVRVVRLPRPAPPAARARARPLVRARLVRREEGAKHRVARERV